MANLREIAKEQGSNIRYTLWNLMGWVDSSPVNLTQKEVDRKVQGGISSIEAINNFATATSANRNPIMRMGEMEDMAKDELVRPIIELYAEEVTQPDINEHKSLWYECNDAETERELNDMLEDIESEAFIYSVAAGIASTGNHYRRLMINEDGVVMAPAVGNEKMRRIWEPTTKRLLGFRWRNEKPNEENILFQEDESVFAPWEFVHFRRMTGDQETEYGNGLLDHLYSEYRKIRMATDQMYVYRLHTMPNKHALIVDVGNQRFQEAMETMHLFKSMLRKDHHMDLGKNEYQTRFNPASLDSMLYIPKRSNDDTHFETLTGDKDVPDIHDLEYATKRFYGNARVPPGYLGMTDNAGLAQASLVSQDIRFARGVRVLRIPVIKGFHELAEIHLALKGKNPDDYKIKVRMSKISSIEEEVNANSLMKQASLASTIADLCQALGIPNGEIIDLVFKEYLDLPQNFANTARLAATVNQALNGDMEGEEGMGGMGGGLDMGGPPMDDLELPDEIGMEEPLAGADAGLGLESTIKNSVLLERRKAFAKKRKTITVRAEAVIKKICESAKKLNESEDEEKDKKVGLIKWDIKNQMEDAMRCATSGRVSLCEDIEERSYRLKTMLPKMVSKGKVNLSESKDIVKPDVKFTSDSTSEIKELNLMDAEEETDERKSSKLHEAVKMVNKRRKDKTK